jgi:hypothetical protein
MSKCKSCTQGPKGVEGHQDLFVTTMSGGPMQFRCRACGALWTRRQNDKSMEWTDSLGNEQGAIVPQSANS